MPNTLTPRQVAVLVSIHVGEYALSFDGPTCAWKFTDRNGTADDLIWGLIGMKLIEEPRGWPGHIQLTSGGFAELEGRHLT